MNSSAKGPSTDCYLTVERAPLTETKVLGSRFTAQALPAASAEAARAHLAFVRKRDHDATHHCSAFRLAPPENPSEWVDDDGEPSGTAGNAIIGRIRHAGLYDLIVIVTRYFGGRKLGTGGLSRAYAEAARSTLEQAVVLRRWRLVRVIVTCDYQTLGMVEAQITRAGELIHSARRTFEPEPRFTLEIPRSQARPFAESLWEATAARARIEIANEECARD